MALGDATAKRTPASRPMMASEWRWLWHQARPFVRYQLGGTLCVLLATAMSLSNPLLMRWLIDDVLPSGRWMQVGLAACLFGAVGVGRVCLSAAANLIATMGVLRFVVQVRRRLLGHLMALPARFYDEQPVGDLVHRMESDVKAVSDFGSDVLPNAVHMVAQTAITVAVMTALDWRLTLVALPFVPIFIWLRRRHGAHLREHAERVRQATGDESNALTEILSGVVQIQLLGAERRMARRYARLMLVAARARWQQRAREMMFSVASVATVSIGTGIIIGYGGSRVLTGQLTAGTLVAFYGYVAGIFHPLLTATELYARLSRMRASLSRLMAIEQTPREVTGVSADAAAPLAPSIGRLGCRQVRFGYAPETPVLSAVTLDLPAGQRVAIVGASGSGKSSWLKLIPRLYDVDEGCLEIDGRSVRDLDHGSLRRAISFVPQAPVLFQGTVRDNLHHGRPDLTAAALAEAIAVACFDEVVARLPEGLETPLGPMGSGLSGGERQRLAIARALVQDRPILILDEATSALDGPTEQRIFQALDAWRARRLVLVASHRLSTCLWADRVIVFDKGRVVADGTHERLYQPGTPYFDLWQQGRAT